MADNSNSARRSQGNRPADNARQATPSSLAGQQNWQGSAEALDFLGLNEAASLEPAGAQAAPPEASSLNETDSTSWLMDGAEPANASPGEAPAPFLHAEAQDAAADDEGTLRAPAVLDASWTEPGTRRASRKRPVLAAVGAVVILAAAGFQLLPSSTLDPRGSDSAGETAQAPDASDSSSPTLDASASTAKQLSNSTPTTIAPRRDGGSARMPVDRSGRAVPVAGTHAAVPGVPANEPDTQSTAPRPEPDSAQAVATMTEPTPQATAAVAALPSATPEVPAWTNPIPDATPAAAASIVESFSAIRPRFQAPSAPTSLTQGSPAGSTPEPRGEATAVELAAEQPLPVTPAIPEVQGTNAGVASDSIRTATAGAAVQLQRVRVIATRTQPLSDAAHQRPAVGTNGPGAAIDPLASQPAPIVTTTPLPVAAQVDSSSAHPPSVANRETSIDTVDVLLLPAPINGVRMAQEADMKSIWNGESIPMERIASPTKVLTPNIGNVRVTLKSKDVFEGRLYAVGLDAVWIEGPFGRMSLANDRIAGVDKLAPEPTAGTAATKAAATAPRADRVRVKSPSGPVFGRLLSSDGLKSTILTDAGLRLSVDAKDVEFLEQLPKITIKQEAPKG